jgi:YfiH family protein
MHNATQKYHIVKEFARVPSLVHGFGTRIWKEEDFDSSPELAHFHHVSLRQTHSDFIRIITQVPHEKMEGDALITDSPGVLLIIKTADCLPALVVDPQLRVVAAVHCGWRGTLKGVIGKTLQTIAGSFGSDLTSLLIALGPCIDKSCYEVGEDVREKYESQNLQNGFFAPHPTQPEKYLFDLRGANGAQILEMGVPREHIFSVDRCTHCDRNLFSFRRDKDHAGRLINFIGLC